MTPFESVVVVLSARTVVDDPPAWYAIVAAVVALTVLSALVSVSFDVKTKLLPLAADVTVVDTVEFVVVLTGVVPIALFVTMRVKLPV
jgi:hypothetical protein